MTRSIIIALAFVLCRYSASEAFSQNTENTCGAWTGTAQELRLEGCTPMLDQQWVVGPSRCEYVAYVLATFRDYLYATARVVTSDAYLIRSIQREGCELGQEGWHSVR